MAITQVGSTTTATSGTAVTGLDVAVPTGIAAGDVLIATFLVNDASELRLPGRWIALDIRDHTTWVSVVAIKIADAADTGNYNFGIWAGTSPMVLTCTAWRGVSPAWPCESGESAHTSFASNQTEPLTTPSVSSTVDAGRVMYIRTARIASTTPITFSESTSGVSELADVGVNASGVSYSAAVYADDADFTGQGSKSGLAITASATESHTAAHTLVLRAKENEQAWTYDGTTTWTRPDSSVDRVVVECWGGGGGGGAGTANPGSGGGGAGGSYARKNTFAVDASSHTVTVASPVGNSTGAGSTGQTTWFKANSSSGVVAVGGPGGAVGSSTGTGGAGGTGTTTGCQGDVVYAGGNGSQVVPDSTGSAGGSGASPAGAGANASTSTPGDTNRYGGGRGGVGRAPDTSGHQGMWYGGGGAGGQATNATDQNGGWGGGGLVRIIYEGKTARAGAIVVAGTAYNATVALAKEGNPSKADATVTAYNPTIAGDRTTNAGQATAAVAAYNASVSMSDTGDATSAPVAVVAYNASISASDTGDATSASVTAVAYDAVASCSDTGDATGAPVSAVAYGASVSLSFAVNPTKADATGTAYNPTPDAVSNVVLAPIGGVSASATAHDAAVAIGVRAEGVQVAVSVGTAFAIMRQRTIGTSEFFKDPSAVLDFEWEWSRRLGQSESIVSHTIIASPGIIVNSSSNTAYSVTAWLSGGAAGKTYTITCRVTTNQRRTYDRTMTIRAVER